MIYNLLLSFLLSAVSYTTLFAADPGSVFGTGKIVPSLQNGGSDLVTTADNVLGYVIGLFYFIAVIIAIYGGFMILTSGGDEEKVKKGKNLVIYMVVGLVVVFLASQIVTWII